MHAAYIYVPLMYYFCDDVDTICIHGEHNIIQCHLIFVTYKMSLNLRLNFGIYILDLIHFFR